ncbi:MAG: DUF4136 domain-containing protein [Cyclobacteriaceae bacterium]|jgi:hypothetical protein|nr:DUF4136 domain-containing protein [Cyclobacteriaceae bacterium]
MTSIKNHQLIITVLLVMMVYACGPTIRIYSDYDRDYDISKFNTYAWADDLTIESRNNPLYYNELNDKRIRQAVDDQLKVKGYRLTQDKPVLKIHYHISVEDRMEIRTDPYGFYGPYWMRTDTYSYSYREGTLIIDFMDAGNSNLLWRGWAVSILAENSNPQKTEVQLREAITDILAKLPAAKH